MNGHEAATMDGKPPITVFCISVLATEEVTMTTSNSLPNGTEIEYHTDLSGFTLVQFNWLPEANEGKALDAMLNDITTNGLINPILADENNCIYDGRLRFLACQKLGVPLKVQRIKSEDGEAAARRGLKHRQMTVLDIVRFVGFIADELEKAGEECSRRKLAAHMTSVYGWQRGTSDKQMDFIRELYKALPGLNDDQVIQMRNATTVNAARKSLGLVKKPKGKKGKRLTMTEIRAQIKEIVDGARNGDEMKTEDLINDLEVLLKQLPESKQQSDKPKASTAKSKKVRSKTKKAN
jgi:hypothetical protein